MLVDSYREGKMQENAKYFKDLIWFTYKGEIYDCTNFNHPGGK
jgi:hypothetical protein